MGEDGGAAVPFSVSTLCRQWAFLDALAALLEHRLEPESRWCDTRCCCCLRDVVRPMGLADGRPPFAQLFWKEGAAAAAAVAAAAGAEGAAEGAADADVGRAHEAGGGGGDNSSDMEGGVPRPLLRSSTHVLAELLCSGYDPTCGILPAAPSVCVTNALVCALCAAEGDACFEGGGAGGGALTVASGKFVFDDAAKGENVCLLCHVPSSRRKLVDLASDAGEACSHAVCLCCMPASVCALEPGVDAPPCPLCAPSSSSFPSCAPRLRAVTAARYTGGGAGGAQSSGAFVQVLGQWVWRSGVGARTGDDADAASDAGGGDAAMHGGGGAAEGGEAGEGQEGGAKLLPRAADDKTLPVPPPSPTPSPPPPHDMRAALYDSNPAAGRRSYNERGRRIFNDTQLEDVHARGGIVMLSMAAGLDVATIAALLGRVEALLGRVDLRDAVNGARELNNDPAHVPGGAP